jgi:PAS domain S-box-containing protein
MHVRKIASAPPATQGQPAPQRSGTVARPLRSLDPDEPISSLRQVGAVLDTLFATAPVGVALCDRDLRYVQVNERLAALNSRPAAEHLGRTPRELFPEHGATWEAYWHQVLVSGEPVVEITMSRALKGAMRHIQASCHPVRIQECEVVGVLTLVNDISERKLAESALQRLYREVDVAARVAEEERTLSEALIAAAPHGVALVDADLRVQRMNAPFAAAAGLADPEFRSYHERLRAQYVTARLVAAAGLADPEVRGPALGELLPALAGVVAPLVTQVLAGGEPIHDLELSVEAAPGRRRLRLSLAPVRLAGGCLLRAGVIIYLSACDGQHLGA